MRRVPQLIRPPREVEMRGQRGMSRADQREYLACDPRKRGAEGFLRFCSKHAQILDMVKKKTVAFELWPGQRRVVDDLVAGRWITALKNRQVGWTWLMAAWALYNVVYSPAYRVGVFNQGLEYAYDFVARCVWIYDRLPAFLQPRITKRTESRLKWDANMKSCEIRAFVAGAKAGRSWTGDLAIFDEAAYQDNFGLAFQAIEPALAGDETGRSGQIVVLTTSSGPTSHWADHWRATYGDHGELLDDEGVGPNHFKPIFIHWSERPGRSQAWYESEVERLKKISPVAHKYEYPNTIEEAFEYAEGRLFPLFTRQRNVGDIKIPEYAQRCRAIDFGETRSAFVVLWLAYIKGPPGLLVSPACPNTIREMLGYRFDTNGLVQKEHDHTCDALRYAVVRHRMKGLVYVYRELYILDYVATGWNPNRDVEVMHEMSGWVRCEATARRLWRPGSEGEIFDLPAVADRSMGAIIALYRAGEIPCVPSPTIPAPKQRGRGGVDKDKWEVLEGIRLVNALIDGTVDIEKFYHVSREQRAKELYAELPKIHGRGATLGTKERELVQLAREILARQREKARQAGRKPSFPRYK